MSDHYVHYSVTQNPSSFEVVFTNGVSGAKVTMSIPLIGALVNQNDKIDKTQVENLAKHILKLLRDDLDRPTHP